MEILQTYKSYKDCCIKNFFWKKDKKSRKSKIPYVSISSFLSLYKKKYHSARRRFVKNLVKNDDDLTEYDININPHNKKDRKSKMDERILTLATFKKSYFMNKLKYKKCGILDDKLLLKKKENDEKIAINRATHNSNYCDLYFSPHNIITKFILNDFFVEKIKYISYENALNLEKIRLTNVLFNKLVFRLIRCYFTEKIEYEYIISNSLDDIIIYMKNITRTSYDRFILSVHISILNEKNIVLPYSNANIEKNYIKLADITMIHFLEVLENLEFNNTYKVLVDLKYYYVTSRQNIIMLKYFDMFNIYRIIKNGDLDNKYNYDQLTESKTTIISGKIEEKNSLYDDNDNEDYNICKIITSLKY